MTTGRDAEYAAFYVNQFRSVTVTVYLILHDRERAEDVTQDAFVQLYLHWSKVSQYDRPEAWVRRVAIRLATRWIRREQLRVLLTRQHAEPPPHAEPADTDLLHAIAALPKQQRAAVVLFYYEDRPMVEVADLLECSVAAAKVTLHRARKALAQRLGDWELDDAR